MAEVSTITAAPRGGTGKGAARAARRNGLVPGMIYGNKLEPVMISLERPVVDRELGQPGFFIPGRAKHRPSPSVVFPGPKTSSRTAIPMASLPVGLGLALNNG